MGKRATIQMVAALAGVSRGTVDRVLNNRSYVRADVRERVLAAIAETGYVSPREAHARQMAASLETLKLGVLLPSEEGTASGRSCPPAGSGCWCGTAKPTFPRRR